MSRIDSGIRGQKTEPNRLCWGLDDLRAEAATQHFLVVGSTGSGKTVLINMLLRSVFEGERGKTRRAVIYDPKQEILPILYGLGLRSRVKVLHPFDKRSSAWNLALDIDSPVSARQLATILVPESEHTGGQGDSFFTDTVRDLLSGVILTFINCVPAERSWTFRDVVLAMLYEPYLRYILSIDRNREGKPFLIGARLMSSYLNGDTRTVSNIRATINSKLAIFEPVAAVWDAAENKFSISEWQQDGSNDILVLGNDEAARAALDAINQTLFKRIVEMVLAKRELTAAEKSENINTSWFFLDEVREAGRLDGLSRLLTKGRSKGAAVVLGFQDIDGLRAVYGNEVANELAGQCNVIALLQMNNPTTAEWSVELMGKFLTYRRSHGVNHGDSGSQVSVTVAGEVESILQTGDLIYLPKTSPENGLSGYFRHPYMKENDQPFQSLQWDEDIKNHLPPVSAEPTDGGFIARPTKEQYLSPWTKVDWERLGLPGEPPPLKEATSKNRQESEEEIKEKRRMFAIHMVFTEMIEKAARKILRNEDDDRGSMPRNTR